MIVIAIQAKAIKYTGSMSSSEGHSLLVERSRLYKSSLKSKSKNMEEEECHWCYQQKHYMYEYPKYLKKKEKEKMMRIKLL